MTTKQTITLSRDLRTILENVATHENRGTHAACMNGNIKTLERRGLIERKLRAPGDPLWLTHPYLGWGLTENGRALLGQGHN
jgi:hypothetical protein